VVNGAITHNKCIMARPDAVDLLIKLYESIVGPLPKQGRIRRMKSLLDAIYDPPIEVTSHECAIS